MCIRDSVSALISFLRTLVFECAAVMFLPAIIGVDGIWLSIVVAEIASMLDVYKRQSIGYDDGYFETVGAEDWDYS